MEIILSYYNSLFHVIDFSAKLSRATDANVQRFIIFNLLEKTIKTQITKHFICCLLKSDFQKVMIYKNYVTIGNLLT